MALLALAALASLAAGCDGSNGSGPATLHVRQTLVPGGSLYIEGSVPYVRVERDGDLVRQVRLKGSRATMRLAPGSYRLVSYQRPCDANCGNLDPATDRCSEAFDVSPGDVVDATVRLTPGSGCTISFA